MSVIRFRSVVEAGQCRAGQRFEQSFSAEIYAQRLTRLSISRLGFKDEKILESYELILNTNYGQIIPVSSIYSL